MNIKKENLIIKLFKSLRGEKKVMRFEGYKMQIKYQITNK